MREVVEEIINAGEPYQFGLEAGSKAELLAVLAHKTTSGSLTILNGYKDEEFMRLAYMGLLMGRRIVVVIEKLSELQMIVRLSDEFGITPDIGLRAKMSVKGQGKWEGSGGDRAKFGLSNSELVAAVRLLKLEGLVDYLRLLHFHIGSQLTDIRSVKEAVTEGARLYSELRTLGAPMEFIDVGGGLGIDYDGSKSTNDSSRNYSIKEYVGDIVYGIKEICDAEGQPHPKIVSESGRALTAHHSCVVAEIVGEIKPQNSQIAVASDPKEHYIVSNIRELSENLAQYSSSQEIFNDAGDWKAQATNAFKLGVLNLEQLATVETLYSKIMEAITKRLEKAKFVPEELKDIDTQMASQYLGNFSVFQSAADIWAIDQILPIVPITRMNEEPTVTCSLVDITCDSDGKIDQFIGAEGTAATTRLHALNTDEQYYIGLFLTGPTKM